MLSELEKKIDLMQIDDDESFRDVIIDVALKDNHCNIAPAGETITFRGNVASEYTANECSLEVITHEKISKDLELSERLEDSLKFYGFDNIDRDLLHSKYLLNMSAEFLADFGIKEDPYSDYEED